MSVFVSLCRDFVFQSVALRAGFADRTTSNAEGAPRANVNYGLLNNYQTLTAMSLQLLADH